MPTFEVRKYSGGRWMLDSIFDDKDDAVDEAKSLMDRSRSLAAIRVVAVTDDETGFREWTVYKQSIVDDENEQATQRASQARREVEAARTRRQAEAAKGATSKSKSGSDWLYFAGLTARFAFVVGIGVAAFALLRRYFL
jgi:hypothetical protein